MKVLYIATECKPFSKAGGIADVAGELPPALRELGVDIEIITPWYGSLKTDGFTIDLDEKLSVGTSMLRGVPVSFLKSPKYFEGEYSPVYIHSATPFHDDALRFSHFSKACLELIKLKKPDIVHINDWGLAYLFAFMEMEGITAKKVITVHNIGYQGNIWKPLIWGTEMERILAHHKYGPLFQDPRPEWYSVNALRLGLELCDCAHTVSPHYAKEMTEPEDRNRYFEGGKGLDRVARRLFNEGRLIGILNGFEYRYPPTELEFRECLRRKKEKKEALGREFRDSNGFLIGFVGRAVEQKFKLLAEDFNGRPVLEHILDMPGVNVAVVASGLPEYEKFLRQYQGRSNYSALIRFDPTRAEDISLGSDLFLMPSLYEPCGITQMESLSCATPPLVRWTGGLVDTVKPHTQPHGTGFGFDGSTRWEVLNNLVKVVNEARELYFADAPKYMALQENGFKERFLWKTAAMNYISFIYKPLLSGDMVKK